MTRTPNRSLRRLLGCLLVLVPLVAAPGAGAAPMLADTPCQAESLENPFTPWADYADYFLIRQGDVGAGDNWDLDGATIADENSDYTIYTASAASVSVASGQSATSPSVCVTIDRPTVRFFVKNTGAATGVLHVDVLYQDDYGTLQTTEIGLVSGSTPDVWGPSPIIPLTAPLADGLGDGSTPVQFRFRADSDGSSWLIDDVYVDPYGKG